MVKFMFWYYVQQEHTYNYTHTLSMSNSVCLCVKVMHVGLIWGIQVASVARTDSRRSRRTHWC